MKKLLLSLLSLISYSNAIQVLDFNPEYHEEFQMEYTDAYVTKKSSDKVTIYNECKNGVLYNVYFQNNQKIKTEKLDLNC